MNKFTTLFHTRRFLSDMLVRYATSNQTLDAENTELRNRIAQKDDELTRAHADHQQSNSFHQSVISNMQARITELTKIPRSERRYDRVSFTTDDGIEIIADTCTSDDMITLDIMGWANGHRDFLASVEYTRTNPHCKDDGNVLHISAFDGKQDDEEPAYHKEFDLTWLRSHLNKEEEPIHG